MFKTLRRRGLLRFLEQIAKEYWRPGPLAFLKRSRSALELERLQKEQSERGTLVVLGSIAWDHPLFQRPQQLARAFARLGWLVFYCDPPWYVRGRSGLWEIEPNLYRCRVSFPAFRVLRAPVVYLSLPGIRSFLEYFQQPRVIYDCIDELEVFESHRRKKLARDHAPLLKDATLVIASSHRLAEKARLLRPDVAECPSGVDHAFFARCLKEELSIPSDLEPLLEQGRPLIGYHGAMARWLDYDLLIKLARGFSEWNFVLIGTDHDRSLFASGVLKERNIRWLGPKRYELLPNYVQRLDVGLIPFRITSLTLAVSPLKLLEYLAAGKPVVSVDLPECRKYEGVLVAENEDDFMRLVGLAQESSRDHDAQLARSRGVSGEDWTRRAEAIWVALNRQGGKNAKT